MLGGFNGIQLSGTDTKHTGVFKNGVPVNDPSSGWYDFGHDLSTGQKVTVITGANSVRFGSGSMAGVVLLEDNFGRSLFTQVAEDETKQYLNMIIFKLPTTKELKVQSSQPTLRMIGMKTRHSKQGMTFSILN